MSGRKVSGTPFWDSTGEQVDPTTATVLATTGDLATGQYEARVTLSTTAAAQFSVQHRNAADDANKTDPSVVYILANSSGQYVYEFGVEIPNESFRVTMDTNLTGTATAHIQVRKIG